MTEIADFKQECCRKCGKVIFWVIADSGARFPVDQQSIGHCYTVTPLMFGSEMKAEVARGVYVSHYYSCPQSHLQSVSRSEDDEALS